MKWSLIPLWAGVGAVILIVVLLPVFQNRGSSGKNGPYSIGMTFRGETSTSRAFTWRYSQGEAGSVLQVARSRDGLEKDQAGKLSFPASRGTRPGEKGLPEGVYQAEASGHSPNTRYWYRMGDEAADVWSQALADCGHTPGRLWGQ